MINKCFNVFLSYLKDISNRFLIFFKFNIVIKSLILQYLLDRLFLITLNINIFICFTREFKRVNISLIIFNLLNILMLISIIEKKSALDVER